MPRIHTVAQDGLITASDKLIGSDGAQNNNFATRNYTVGGISNFVLDGTHAGSFTTITSSGNGTIGADLSVAGNLAVTGNATISGNLTFGDANTDTVAFGADIVSHIIPDVTDTYDLGASDKIWGNIYVNNITGIGNLQLGDAATDAASEIKAYGDLELKADSDNDNGYIRGVEIFRTRFDMNGLRIHLNKNLYDENNNLVPDTAFATIEVGDVIYGLGNYGSNYATNYSEAVTSVDGWYAANDTFVHATDSTGAAYFRLSVASGIAYASNAYLTILPAGQALVSNSNNKSIKFYEGTTSIGTLNASSFVIPGKATIGNFTIPNTLGTTEQVLSVPSSGSELEWKSLNINGYFFPSATGTAGQILKIPSSGTRLEWASAVGVPHIINDTYNTNSLSIGYGSWSGNGPQSGDGGAIENVAVGIGAMNSILQGDGNVSVGYNANTGLSFGDFNIAIGHKAGASADSSAVNLTSGDRNILIGANAGVTNGGTFNAIVIGTHHGVDDGDGIVAMSHQTIIGNDQTNNAIVKGLRQEVRTSPATDTLSDVRGTDANKITVLDSTSAITITLPDHATNSAGNNVELGKTYTFVVKTAATGGNIHKIVCANTTLQKIIGTWAMAGVTPSFSYESNNNSAINMDGTTKGGGAGTVFSLTCIADGIWLINNAAIIMSGSVSSPFSTS